MSYSVLRALACMALLAVSTAGMAATMDITASFSPSMDRPENNTFTNTTPQSGYCVRRPEYCSGNRVSADLPLRASPSRTIEANSSPRDGLYIKMPSTFRSLTVTSETGAQAQVQFRVSTIGFIARYPFGTIGTMDNWVGGGFISAPRPCISTGLAFYSDIYYEFLWRYNTGDSACYKISTISRSGYPVFNDNSIGYELQTPDPLKMEAGIYTGSLTLSVGPGGDIDFGDNYQASDTELTINFTLSVNHEFKLTTTADDQAVSLQPCASGRVCTADEGQANWERWMVSRATPQLTGRSNFSLSTSGAFTVYLECEQQSGPDCALRSDKMPSQTVPVSTLLTLPDNIVDNVTGSTVSKRRLEAGRDLTKNVFVTKTFGQNRAGSIDFLVGQKDVDTMLATRPDTYRGAVTVIFDPKIY
ncbi:hypothetical protein DFO52_11327 [Enterobacter sp. AG326]|uniref:hypothetical protein n=1 Tax=Enterobacter sp. AG326 TaxID=2183902 RepID=UPI0010E1AC07|nr:hypothetical protein [Enterobacter sp. AG326]TDP13506.1 hypothetical protein DFO52_11327 [Enterobacter sp. AG326]